MIMSGPIFINTVYSQHRATVVCTVSSQQEDLYHQGISFLCLGEHIDALHSPESFSLPVCQVLGCMVLHTHTLAVVCLSCVWFHSVSVFFYPSVPPPLVFCPSHPHLLISFLHMSPPPPPPPRGGCGAQSFLFLLSSPVLHKNKLSIFVSICVSWYLCIAVSLPVSSFGLVCCSSYLC